MDAAPDSPLVVEINAENFEKHGDWNKAIAEYRVLLKREPTMPGIHYRIGQIILNLPATAASNEDARKEFEQELKVYPQNAGAEYFLGELARKSGHLPQAIEHFTNAHAYQQVGRKEDAAREFALQKSTSEKIQQNTETVKRNVSGVPTPDSGGK